MNFLKRQSGSCIQYLLMKGLKSLRFH